EVRDLKPGNAVVLYYRSFSPEWQTHLKNIKLWDLLDKWEADRAPPKVLRFVLLDNSLKEIDQGARRAFCDWEMLDRLRKEGMGMLRPDIQSFRTSIQLLRARAHFEIMDKHLDKALYTLQTSFAFSRHVSEGPTLIQSLVGAAMTNITVEEVEFFIQQP